MESLTNEERERLYLLVEEAGEVIHAATKILRHGYDSHNPNDPAKTRNYWHLKHEIIDLLAVIRAMAQAGDTSVPVVFGDGLNDTWQKKLRYTYWLK